MTKAAIGGGDRAQDRTEAAPRPRTALDAMLSCGDRNAEGRRRGAAGGLRQLHVPVERKAGMARNPRTGAAVKRPATKTARFRIGDALKSAAELDRLIRSPRDAEVGRPTLLLPVTVIRSRLSP